MTRRVLLPFFIALGIILQPFLAVFGPVGPGLAYAQGPSCDFTTTPPESPTPIMWLNAETLDETLDPSDPIATWPDDSGNGNSISQSDGGLQATFTYDADGNPAAMFSTDIYTSPIRLAEDTSYTVLLVATGGAAAYGEGRTVPIDSGSLTIGASAVAFQDGDANPNNLYTVSGTSRTPIIVEMSRDNNNAIAAIYESEQIDETVYTNMAGWDGSDFDTANVGAREFSNTPTEHVYFSGNIYEFVVFDSYESDLSEWALYLSRWQCDEEILSCPLVPNFDFSTTDDWTVFDTGLVYPAAIISDTLRLGPSDYAQQNLSLEPDTSYDVTVIISNTVGISDTMGLAVGLDFTNFDILDISGPGGYTAVLTTLDNPGVHTFSIEWYEEALAGYIYVDSVCLTLASEGPGGEQLTCIEPANGEFNTSSGWDFHRGAAWLPLSQNVSLPANTNENDSGLVITSNTFDLPDVVTDTPYLLLSFDARSINDDGAVGTQVDAVSDYTAFFQTYTVYYTYENDITSLAGESGATLAFANTPTQTLFADVNVDNACIFLSDRPPNLPTPTDPNSINPTQIGFGIHSCADVDGIWAWLGVNMAQYRANYAAGFSIWDDPLEWVVSAVFVTLGDWSCLFMLALAALLNLIEYFLNNFLNVYNWIQNITPAAIDWLNGLFSYAVNSVFDIASSYGSFLAAWSSWIGDNLAIVAGWIGSTFNAWSDWIGNSLAYASDWIGNSLAAWSDWIGTNLANASNWIGSLLASWADWIGYFLASLANWIGSYLAQAWDGLMLLISYIIQFWVDLWNNYIYPFLQALWDWLTSISLFSYLFDLFWDLMLSLWDLLLSIIAWLWENMIMVGDVPFQISEGFNDGLQSTGFDLINCSGGSFWCYVLIGFDLINSTVSPTIMYPLVIIGIILMTIIVLEERVKELVNFALETIREI